MKPTLFQLIFDVSQILQSKIFIINTMEIELAMPCLEVHAGQEMRQLFDGPWLVLDG